MEKCMHPSTGECIKNCGYPYNGIVFGNRNEWIANTCYNMDQPLKYYTNERSQMQKTTFWMILFMWKVQKGQTLEAVSRSLVVWGWV